MHLTFQRMKWITRERPKIDRIACPWLIKNFVDKDADFIYVAKEQVFNKAKEFDAIPYDIPGAEYSHYGEECTFDYIVKKHEIKDWAELVQIYGEDGMSKYLKHIDFL